MGGQEPMRWGQAIDDPNLPMANHMGYLWQWQTNPATGQKQWYCIRRVPEADPPSVAIPVVGATGATALGATAKATGQVPWPSALKIVACSIALPTCIGKWFLLVHLNGFCACIATAPGTTGTMAAGTGSGC